MLQRAQAGRPVASLPERGGAAEVGMLDQGAPDRLSGGCDEPPEDQNLPAAANRMKVRSQILLILSLPPTSARFTVDGLPKKCHLSKR